MTTTMNPATATSTPAIETPTRTESPTRPVWQVGAVAGLVAAAATNAVAGVATAIDIPMKAASSDAATAQTIPVSGYAMGTLTCTAIGTVLAMILARRANRPAATFVV